MSAIKVLKKDHDRFRGLFGRYDRTGKFSYDKKRKLFEELRAELEVHTHADKEILYPELRALSATGRGLVADGNKDHREIHALIGQIERLEPDNENFGDKFEALIEHVEWHIELEERKIFRFAEENCPTALLETLGAEIEAMQRDSSS